MEGGTRVESRDDRFDRLSEMCPLASGRDELLREIAAARAAYMSGEAPSPGALAVRFPKLPLEACKRLVDDFGWRKDRMEELADARVAADLSYLNLIRCRRDSEVKKVLDGVGPAVEWLSNEIKSLLGPAADKDSKYRTIDARRLAEALAQLSGVLLQAVAADGRMPAAPEAAQGGGGPQRQPWLNITAQGPVSVSRGGTMSASHGAEPKQAEATGEGR